MVPPEIPSSTLPCGCLPNGSSTTEARTCDLPRTLAAKLYQPPSVRSQYCGRVLLASWTRSMTLTVALCAGALPEERVPSRSVMNDQDESVSIAEPTPTKPPPFL